MGIPLLNHSMKTSKEIRRLRLMDLIAESGNQTRFCERTGKAQAQISSIITSAKAMGDQLARELEKTCDKEIGWMDNYPESIAEAGAGYKTERPGAISIPLLDGAFSMGDGAYPQRDEVIDHLTVSKRWVIENFSITQPGNLRLVTGMGDSMQETIYDGDIVVIDTGVKELKIDGIFALARGDELFLKRIQRLLDGSFMIISDNADRYKPYQLKKKDMGDLVVCGRALWVWNGKRL